MKTFNTNTHELDMDGEKLNDYVNTNINRVISMYNDLETLSKYTDTNMSINSNILQLVMQQMKLKAYKKEYNNFQNNFMYLNFPDLLVRDANINEETLKSDFSNKEMYEIIRDFLGVYHPSLQSIFELLIANHSVYEVPAKKEERSCARFNEINKSFLFIENNHSIDTMANLVNRLTYLRNLKEGKKESSDYREFQPKMYQKEFLEFLEEECNLEDEVRKFYINYYKNMQMYVKNLDELKKYPSFKDLMESDKLYLLDSIPNILGDALSDSSFVYPGIEKNIYKYLKLKKPDYFDKSLFAHIGKNECGIAEGVNERFKKYVKTK